MPKPSPWMNDMQSTPAPDNEEITIERMSGLIVAVGGINTKVAPLPDWDLSYIEYPEGMMARYRDRLLREHVKIEKVTKQRIYFSER